MEKMRLQSLSIKQNYNLCYKIQNVMGSRGSVIPLFLDQIKHNIPITITDPLMTRFMMRLERAVDLVLFAFNQGKNGDIFVQKTPACNLKVLADSILELLEIPKYPIKIIGTRHGEKLYESLLNERKWHFKKIKLFYNPTRFKRFKL